METFFRKMETLGITQKTQQEALNCKERITLIQSQTGEVFWLKKTAPARGFWRYKALNLISRWLKLPLLKAVPQKGGIVALQTEVSRINSLSKNGVLVPQIIYKSDDFILLSHLGNSVTHQFKDKQNSQKHKQELLTACLSAIKTVHEKKQYLSQAFVRNMVQISDKPISIGFIDFEDDPQSVMSVSEAQARDVLLFINSVARFFIKDESFFQQAITDFLNKHDPKVVSLLHKTSHRLQWVTKLPFQKALGHDYQKLKLGLIAIRHL